MAVALGWGCAKKSLLLQHASLTALHFAAVVTGHQLIGIDRDEHMLLS